MGNTLIKWYNWLINHVPKIIKNQQMTPRSNPEIFNLKRETGLIKKYFDKVKDISI